MLEIINNTVKPKVTQKYIILKIYNTLSLSIFLYGTDTFTIGKGEDIKNENNGN